MSEEQPEQLSAPFVGRCDGCPSGGEQLVRRASGPWGAATVCPHHEEHTE